MKFLFKRTQKPSRFFKILPQDWQDIIVPQWNSYQDSSSIYIMECNGQIIAGGIIFSKTPPNATPLEINYNYLFDKGYLYLGFIFVIPEYRGKQIASGWLGALKNKYKNQPFWLTIEEFGLKFFYEKNGFKLIDENTNSIGDEWVMISK